MPAAGLAPYRLGVVTMGDAKSPVGLVTDEGNGVNLIISQTNLTDFGL